MEGKNKFNDFTPATINNLEGELLVLERIEEKYYIVDEEEFDSADNKDELRCEMLDKLEIKDRILYSRFEQSKFKMLKRSDLEAPFTTGLPNHLKEE